MNERTRNIVRIAALADVVIAIGLLGAIFVTDINLPILVPILLFLSGVGLFIATMAMK